MTEGGSSLLSGPKFFPQECWADHWSGSVGATSFHASAEEPDLVEQSALHAGSLCLRMGQPGACANGWEPDLQLDRGARWASCRFPELRSRRSRRRRNRRQRIEGGQAAVGVCGQATSAVRGVGPARWTIQQELGGPKAVGLGGPDCVSLPSLLDEPANVRPVGCTRKATHILHGSTHCPVDEAIPFPCSRETIEAVLPRSSAHQILDCAVPARVHLSQEGSNSLDIPIEPLPLGQGAPKTQEEEVMSRWWMSSQEAVGRGPMGLGGPAALLPALGAFLNGRGGDSGLIRGGLLEPDVRPAGCTQQQSQGTEPPYRAEIALPEAVSPTMPPTATSSPRLAQQQSKLRSVQRHELWLQLRQAVQNVQEDSLVDVVSRLEEQSLIHEGTFPWFAADLAMQVCHGDELAPALWAIDDVLANLGQPGCPRTFRVISANITTWRKEIAAWMPEQRADVFLFQETHLPEYKSEQLANDVGSRGYQALFLPALPTGNGGFSGGLAICSKKHLDVRQVTSFSSNGAGFQAVALRVRGTDLYLVNLYLKSGEGFQSPTNVSVLATLLPFLASVRGSFLAAGDFNDDFDTLSSTNMAMEAKGKWRAPPGPTIASGGHLDFGIISRALSPVVKVALQWLTPFKPHAALVWELPLSEIRLRMPQARSFKPQPLQPQPFQPVASSQAPHVLGLRIPNSVMAQTFADLSCAVELSVFGNTQGRGVHIPVVRLPLQIQGKPGAGWGGNHCAFWGRIVTWLESSQKSPQRWPFGPQMELNVTASWQGSPELAQTFAARMSALQGNQSGDAVLSLLQEAKHQLQQATRLWMHEKSTSYTKWLDQSSKGGMRPLFQCVKQHENKTVRPFLDAPLQERIYLRWRQWYAVWQGSGVGEVDDHLAEEVKRRAIAQAQSLPPISVQRATAYFRRAAKKAPGIDGWTSDILRNMSQEATQAVLDFLRTCELQAEWPIQIAVALVALLPKSTKKERPIALLHFLYRSYIRLRWDLIASWQGDYSKLAVWDKALPGSQVLDVALGRLMRGEATRQASAHMVTLFLDLENFYDAL